jgi:hypothetical protein
MRVSEAEQPPTARVRLVIPHHYRPGGNHLGHGSGRSDPELYRVIAFSRCLGSVLALARGETESLLDIAGRCIGSTDPCAFPRRRLPGLSVELHLFVTGDSWLKPVVAVHAQALQVHHVDLEDPLSLPAEARRFLLEHPEPAALHVYLEDDLVIQDPLFIDKFAWFLERTQHRLALMPHRYELTHDPRAPRLYVDGPIDADYLQTFQTPQTEVANGTFWDGCRVNFDIANNPHSGMFAISEPQRRLLQERGVAEKGFIGPLETVATYTVLQHFPVLKPSWPYRHFLTIEHGHPSFLYWRETWPRRRPG